MSADELGLLRQRVADLEGELIEARAELERVRELRAQATLAGVVKSLGLAVAVGEATMPDRAVSSVSVSAQTYLVPQGGGVALRFQPAESAEHAVGLSTTTLELAKVPAAGPALPSLYAVLEEKQRLYSAEPWASRPESRPLLAELGRTLADAGAWDLTLLAERAAAIAELEQQLVRAEAGGTRSPAATEARGTTDELASLASKLRRKSEPVAGDLHTLVGALHTTTRTAEALAAQTTETATSPRS
jgi:hypothetical protein